MFGLWLAGRLMGEHLGLCTILGNLCGLWICVRICCSSVVRLGLSQSCVQIRSTAQWMAGWPPTKRLLEQIDCAMDGWVAACQAAPGPDRLCDGWLGGCLPSGAWTLSLHILKVSWGTLGSLQALLACAQVCGAFALLFGLWPAGQGMGACLGPCRIVGNLCGLWICTRICCSFAVQSGLFKSPMANWPIGQLADWPIGHRAWARSTLQWMAG